MNQLLNLILSVLKTLNVLQEEPSYIWKDVDNGLVYLCYTKGDNVLETDSQWKVKVIEEPATNHYSFKRTSRVVYNVPICVGAISTANIEAQLTALYGSGIFKYHKTYS